jgi:hypothetical protein
MDNHQSHTLVPTVSQSLEVPADMDVFRVGDMLAKSGYFKDVRDMAQAVTKILAGREMGFGPIASLTGVFIQQGRPCYSANMIAAAIKKSRRYDYRVKRLDVEQCDLEFAEGGKLLGISTFTIKDAEQAGLLQGANAHSWKHYPRNMLFARALTNGARFHCPDVFGGVPIYTPEEMNVTVDGTGMAMQESGPQFTPTPALRPEPPQSPQFPAPEKINPAQQKRLFPLIRDAGVSVDDFKAYLQLVHELESTKDITRTQYDVICNAITSGGVASWLLAQSSDEVKPEEEREIGAEG